MHIVQQRPEAQHGKHLVRTFPDGYALSARTPDRASYTAQLAVSKVAPPCRWRRCVDCSDGTVSKVGAACATCGEFTVANAERTACEGCSSNEYYTVSKGKAQCTPCEAGLEVSATKEGCVCGTDAYDASVTTIRCVDDEFSGAGTIATLKGCQKCPGW